MLLPVTVVAGDCPGEKLFSFHKVKESKTVFPTNLSDDVGTASINIPLDTLELSSNTMPVITDRGLTTRISVKKRLFRYTAGVSNLTDSNLTINYQVNEKNRLQSVDDPSSTIEVIVTTRELIFSHKNKHTRVDAYVDLLLDYSSASKAGAYTGVLEVTVECSK